MLINVILGGKTIQTVGGPAVEGGYPAMMDTDDLEHRPSLIDNENERTQITEYWLNGELVHRSVDMFLKKGLFAEGVVATFE